MADHSGGMDEIQKRIDGNIKRFGWHVQAVMPGPEDVGLRTFAYTVGMPKTLKHAELMMIGFRPELMQSLLNVAGEQIKEGVRFGDWTSSDKVIQGFPVWFREVPEITARKWALLSEQRYKGPEFGLLQMFLPDVNGLFPWDPGCNPQFIETQGMFLPEMKPKSVQ